MQGAAKILTEPVVAFPLGLVKRLVTRGLVRKVFVLLCIGQQVHVERIVQVGLDHQQRTFRAHRRAFTAISPPRPGALPVANACQQHAATRMVVGHVFRRQHRELLAAQREQAGRFVTAVKVNLGTEIDAGLAHQVLHIAKLIPGVATRVRQDDEAQLPFEQRINAAVFKMPAIGQIPPRSFHTKKSGRCLAGQHHGFGDGLPRQMAQPAQSHPFTGCLHPVAEPHAQKVHQQRQATRGVGTRAG